MQQECPYSQPDRDYPWIKNNVLNPNIAINKSNDELKKLL